MIHFLAFAFKLLFSAVIICIYAYLLKKEKDQIVIITLIGVFSTSITAIVSQLPTDVSSFAIAGAIFAALYITNSLVKNESLYDKIIIIFSCVIGIIIGIGSILQSFILMLLLYGISQTSLLEVFNLSDNVTVDKENINNSEDLMEEK